MGEGERGCAIIVGTALLAVVILMGVYQWLL